MPNTTQFERQPYSITSYSVNSGLTTLHGHYADEVEDTIISIDSQLSLKPLCRKLERLVAV